MNTREPLEDFTFGGGYDSSLQPLDPRTVGKLCDGSFNIINIDNGRNVPYGGMTSEGANTGSRILVTIGDTWGGIKDVGTSAKNFTSGDVSTSADTITITAHGFTTGWAFTFSTAGTLPAPFTAATPTYYVIVVDANTIQVASSYTNALAGTEINITTTGSGTSTITTATVTASGSLFQDIGSSIWGIGAGQPHLQGSTTPFAQLTLSSLLKVLIPVSGSYTNASSGAFVAGLSQPSSPTVAVIDTPSTGYVGLIDGAVSFKLARIRLSTGARSIASLTSVVVVPNKKTVRVTFPLAATGQTYWHLFATQQGYGGIGIHYQLAYNGALDIAETTIAASTVGGIARSIEIDYRDGDLESTEAYIDDYPPPAGTQAARVESSMVVFGCYSDSVSSPTGSSPGTCAAVSLPNYPESYKPRHILFFPEPIVHVLSRLIDSYCYVLCRNSIHVVQFVGWRDDLPSCTMATVSPEIGIQYPHNVAQAYGRLFLWTENAGIIAMNPDGSLDYQFGSAIRKYTKDWDMSTVVGFEPITRSITVANGTMMFSFCLQSGNWSAPIYLSDMVTGNAEASVTTRGEQIMSINNAGSHTAYSMNQGGTSLPVFYASNFSECTTKKGKNVYQLDTSGEFSVAGTLFLGLHSDFRTRMYRDVTTTSGSSTIGSATAGFTFTDTNREIFLFGTGIGNLAFTGDSVTNLLTFTSTSQMRTGQAITFSGLSGCAPLANGTTYYIIVIDSTDIEVATTYENAITETPINLTTDGSGTIVINFLAGRITAPATTSFTITNLDGTALTASATLTGVTIVIANQVFMTTVSGGGYQDTIAQYPEMIEAPQVSVSAYFYTDCVGGQIFSSMVSGDISLTSEIGGAIYAAARPPVEDTYHIMYQGVPITYNGDNIDYFH